jgi:hypothetical protein
MNSQAPGELTGYLQGGSSYRGVAVIIVIIAVIGGTLLRRRRRSRHAPIRAPKCAFGDRWFVSGRPALRRSRSIN